MHQTRLFAPLPGKFGKMFPPSQRMRGQCQLGASQADRRLESDDGIPLHVFGSWMIWTRPCGRRQAEQHEGGWYGLRNDFHQRLINYGYYSILDAEALRHQW